MGDRRFESPYRRLEEAHDRAEVLQEMTDEDVVAALAATSEGGDAYLANVLATEAQNRVRRAHVVSHNLGEGVFTVDAAHRVTSLNPAAIRMLGYSYPELKGRDFHDVVHFQHLDGTPIPREECSSVQALRTGETVHRRDHGDALTRKDGSIFEISMTSAPILREGEVVGAVTVFRDITEDRQAEERERRLAAIADATEDAIVGADLDTLITSWNRGAERMFGYTREEAVGRPIALLVPPEREHEIQWRQQVLTEGEPTQYETERIRKDGRRVPVELTLSPVIGDAGAVGGFAGIYRDITERKRAEQAIRERDERFRLVAAATHDVVWDWDARADTLWWSDTFTDALGHPAEAAPETFDDWARLVHPDDLERVLAEIDAWLAGDEDDWHAEYRFRTAEGSYVEVLDRGRVLRDEHGEPVRVLGVLMDITERKRAEVALRESEERFRTLFDENPLPTFLIDPDTLRFLSANEAASHKYGWTREEFREMRMGDLRPSQDVEPVHSDLENHAHGTERHAEWRHLTKDGRFLPVEVTSRGVEVDGRPAILAVAHDVTERKQAERALEAAREGEREAYRTLQYRLATLLPAIGWGLASALLFRTGLLVWFAVRPENWNDGLILLTTTLALLAGGIVGAVTYRQKRRRLAHALGGP